MRLFHFFLIIYFGLLFFIGCSEEDLRKNPTLKVSVFSPDTLILSPSMKGWELYSLPHDGGWYFSLLPGTNRAKSPEEIVENKILVSGLDSLKAILDRLPKGEDVFLMKERPEGATADDNQILYHTPPQNYVEEISQYCQQLGLIFYSWD